MTIINNQANKTKHSLFHLAIMFLAINCIIVSVLTFSLSAIAIVTSNYDKWFPVAILLSIGLMFIGRFLIRFHRRDINNMKY